MDKNGSYTFYTTMSEMDVLPVKQLTKNLSAHPGTNNVDSELILFPACYLFLQLLH